MQSIINIVKILLVFNWYDSRNFRLLVGSSYLSVYDRIFNVDVNKVFSSAQIGERSPCRLQELCHSTFSPFLDDERSSKRSLCYSHKSQTDCLELSIGICGQLRQLARRGAES